MRVVVGLLTCLNLVALEPALANDPTPVGTTGPSAPVSSNAAAPASGASTPAPPPSSASAGTATGSAQPGQPAPANQATTTGQAAPTGQTPPSSSAAAGAPATAAAPSAASKSKTPELTPAEKDLLSQGYKLEMRGTDKHFCRNESELGSRFPHRVCITPEQAAATKRSSQDFLNDVQRPSNNPPGK